MPMPVEIPALRKAMSSRPCWSVTAFTAAPLSSYDETSHATNVPPVSAAIFSPLSRSTSETTTCAPDDASRRATSAPKPFAPPVTHATFPSNRGPSSLFSATEAPLSAEDLLADRTRPWPAQVDELLRPLRPEVLVRRRRGGIGTRLDVGAQRLTRVGQAAGCREEAVVDESLLAGRPLVLVVAAGLALQVVRHALAGRDVGE